MKITIPRNSAEEARVYLKAWLDLHEGPGVERVKRMLLIIRTISLVAGVALVAGVFLAWHPLWIGAAGIVLGYTGAETGALLSRMRAWPHNEKYFNWDGIKEALAAHEHQEPPKNIEPDA